RKRSCLPGSGRAGPGLYHGVGAGEDDRLVAVVVADEVRRPSVAASYLDDLDQMIALTDRAAMHAEPISHLCSHDPPPSAAARKTPPVGPATEVPGGGRLDGDTGRGTSAMSPTVRAWLATTTPGNHRSRAPRPRRSSGRSTACAPPSAGRRTTSTRPGCRPGFPPRR